ncbi:MAG: hypothetical protein ACOC04_06165 [Halothece sp.]
MTNLEPNSSNVSQGRKWEKLQHFINALPDIRNIIFILVAVGAILVVLEHFEGIQQNLSCLAPKSPLEPLLLVVGMLGLTAVGVTFTPAAVFGLLIWLIVKAGYFCN